MARYIIQLKYKGTLFHGWQIQENAPSVQGVVNEALCTLLREHIETVGAGRTDTGVHAHDYIAHFDTRKPLPYEAEKLVHKMNGMLPIDISIVQIMQVHDTFHARFDATSRIYKYFISPQKNPFYTELSYFYPYHLDVDAMNRAAAIMFDYVDFTSFSKSHTDTKTNNCRIMQAQWGKDDGMLVFTIKADRFLRNMVRAITGTLLDVGRGRIGIDDFRSIIEQKDRTKAGMSVPAHGLFLWEVEYNTF